MIPVSLYTINFKEGVHDQENEAYSYDHSYRSGYAAAPVAAPDAADAQIYDGNPGGR